MRYAIYFTGKIQPSGGPSGYLFNLQKGLLALKHKKILIVGGTFLFNRSFDSSIESNRFWNNYFLRGFNFIYRKIVWHLYTLPSLRRAKIVHCHYSPDFDKILPLLSKKTIKVFTSHSPEPYYLEYQKILLEQGVSRRELEMLVLKQKEIDKRAFLCSDRVVFPCLEAVECYSKFLDSINFDYSKIDTVMTGAIAPVVNIEAREFRDRHGIPIDSRLIAYVGRKTSVKGFDIFLSVAKLMSEYPKFCFICAGVGDLEHHIDDNIIDLGWTNDPGSLLNSCDIVLAPNRSTFFDIGILQAISLSKPVITSMTGGNKWFIGKAAGVHLVKSNEPFEYVDYILSIISDQTSRINRHSFVKYFGVSVFAKNYLRYYDSLV